MEEESSSAFAQPWGRAAGFFIGCAVTVVGSLRSVGAAELLLRVVISAVFTAVVVRTFLEVLRLVSPVSEDEG